MVNYGVEYFQLLSRKPVKTRQRKHLAAVAAGTAGHDCSLDGRTHLWFPIAHQGERVASSVIAHQRQRGRAGIGPCERVLNARVSSSGMAELQSGRFKYNDGGWYVGQHCGDGKRHGQGIYTYPNGDVFDGSFIMGKCVSAASLPVPVLLARSPPPRRAWPVRLRLPRAPRAVARARDALRPVGDGLTRARTSPAGGKELALTSIRRAAGTRANGKTIAW